MPAPPDQPRWKARLLVVDDDPLIRQVIIESLRHEGYQMVEAGDGLEAFERIAVERFDLIILDLEMPVMNGFDVLHRLRERRSLRDIPVIVVSGWGEFDAILRAIRAGAVDHLGKPFNHLLLRTRIEASLERKRWRDQEQAYLRQIEQERARSEQLLLNILPAPIADRLKRGETTIADSFSEVTVLFADLVGFTSLSARIAPEEIVRMLNDIFSAFDDLAHRHALEKIKTIGDCYMAVAGLPAERPDHAPAAASMALEMIKEIRRFNDAYGFSLRLRIGLHTGLVVAGIIGKQKFIYDLWGDTVNLASRMESHGEPGRVQISATTAARLGEAFQIEPRGVIDVKGKGEMPTYWVVGRRS